LVLTDSGGFVEHTALAKSLEEAVEEDLRLTLFVARDVFLTPRDEFHEFFPARHDGQVCAEDLSASMTPSSKQDVAAGMDEANALTCRRSNEKSRPITHEKWPNQRAGSNSCGPGMGSVQGIQVHGLF
jgi:hypothetical protein